METHEVSGITPGLNTGLRSLNRPSNVMNVMNAKSLNFKSLTPEADFQISLIRSFSDSLLGIP